METQSWTRIREKTLLGKRVSDLGLDIKGSSLEPLIYKLYDELSQKGLIYRPPCFLADEWFCPENVAAIGIPFYLVHPRLRRLEKKMLLDVEGGRKAEFMKLLRHEAGHAYAYAYRLNKKSSWVKLFGSSNAEYPNEENYRFRPYSRSYVIHLSHGYAQSHPDEDFAETFAVWLTPGFKWNRHYRNWKALQKLEYVDKIMGQIVNRLPLNPSKGNPQKYSPLGMKLSTYYKRKKKFYEEDLPEFYDNDLKTLFSIEPTAQDAMTAARYLRRARTQILDAVCHWTKEKKYTADGLFNRLIERCEKLKLWVRDSENLNFQVSAFISALVMNYSYTGKFKR